MVFPRTLCDDISSSDYGATDKASFSFSSSFLCLATAITGLAFIFLVVAVAFHWPWCSVKLGEFDANSGIIILLISVSGTQARESKESSCMWTWHTVRLPYKRNRGSRIERNILYVDLAHGTSAVVGEMSTCGCSVKLGEFDANSGIIILFISE
ncbi:hypothetical protein AVEN_197669-1 [Araneus ventricosus]|uniref:Uncharacterized protein n=1 Tax=Araneus ventricosus TaxID=182803 RepID=A0A4Y2GXG0_ARAVE|nr:hypothetical protein AVEN_197669-1 [Araneus ventricosus]